MAVPASGDRKVIATVWGTVKWFNVRNGYGFIKRNDTEEDVFVHQTAIKKKNPRKHLRSVGDRETVAFEVVGGEKDAETANGTGPRGVPVQGGTCAPDRNHYRRSPHRRGLPRNHQQNYQNSESGEKDEGSESAPEGQALPQAKVPTLLHAETLWATTTVFQPSCGNQGAGEQGRPVRQSMYRGYRP